MTLLRAEIEIEKEDLELCIEIKSLKVTLSSGKEGWEMETEVLKWRKNLLITFLHDRKIIKSFLSFFHDVTVIRPDKI
jgi:hypothetical protein